jgi:hypothetical protein
MKPSGMMSQGSPGHGDERASNDIYLARGGVVVSQGLVWITITGGREDVLDG